MKKFSALLVTALSGLVFVASHQSAIAQQRPGGGGGGGGRGNFNREDMMARIMDRYKSALEMSDDEWGVVRPMVENVMEKQRETRGNRFGGFGGPGARGGRGGRPGDAQANQDGQGGRGGRGGAPGGDQAGDPTQDALQAALDSKTATPAEITAKLQAYRNARKVREDALAKARAELSQVLTASQTARMVLMGVLE